MKRAVAVALTLAGCGGGAPSPTSVATTPAPADAAMPDSTTAERRYLVYDGSELVLELSDRPGPIRSTAHGGPPVRHPFLSASARSAVHEDPLRKLLVASTSFDGFVAALERAGFRLEPVAP